MNIHKQKVLSFILALIILIAIVPSFSANAAPMPVISYYSFQPNGTPYHYYSFGDELFYNITYDGILKCSGYYLARMPRDTIADGWLHDIALIEGTYQIVNARYKVDTPDKSTYPTENQDMLLMLTVAGQNGPALFNSENNTITLYMTSGANLKTPEMKVGVTSLGYQYFQGAVWWSLTNDISEKEKLETLYLAGVDGNTFMGKGSWEDFEKHFNASMENDVDLSKQTWLTVCGGTIGGYFLPVFSQYEILVSTDENPLAKQSLAPHSAEFDKRLLYQANVVFNFTNYTKKLTSFSIDGKDLPENTVTFNDFMIVINKDYLSSAAVGDTVSLTVRFDDGSEDTAKINIIDTTPTSYTSIFEDIGTSTPAWEFVHPLVQKGIITEDGGKYRPSEYVTRAEFYTLLQNFGVQIDEPSSPSSEMIATDAEQLLFEVLTSKQFEEKYKALNKQHIWSANTYGNLTADDFLFFDKTWPTMGNYYMVDLSDMNHAFTRAQAAEVVHRFVKLIEYADDLLTYQNPKVAPTSSTVLVNGKAIVFDSYNIGGNNYFKLRDLAFVLNGTAKQFAVNYNDKTGSITLKPGEEYIAVGGEMASKGTTAQSAILSQLYLYIEGGYTYKLMPYKIGGNNYFKLRDIASILDFGADWDSANSTVIIDTSKAYTPE